MNKSHFEPEYIEVVSARENNLAGISFKIPKNRFVVITGVSGSGKSSIAFDTIFPEGQRRYIDSLLSLYAKQFIKLPVKPDVEMIKGLSPTIAISQKSIHKSVRSTVATATEIYEYLRLLYASIGIPHSLVTGNIIQNYTVSGVVDAILALPKGTRVFILSPIVDNKKGDHTQQLKALCKKYYSRFKINNTIYTSDSLPNLSPNEHHSIAVVVDRFVIADNDFGNRLASSVEDAFKLSEGILHLDVLKTSTLDAVEKTLIFYKDFICPDTGIKLGKLEPRFFSFNSPYGACTQCKGLGKVSQIDLGLLIPEKTLAICSGAIPQLSYLPRSTNNNIMRAIQKVFLRDNINLDTPWEKIPDALQQEILHGDANRIDTPFSAGGLIQVLENTISESELKKYHTDITCTLCKGFRIKRESLSVKVAGLNIGQIINMTVYDAYNHFNTIQLSDSAQLVASRLIQDLTQKLQFLIDVGLDYLVLGREAGTLSGGESQRLHLAAQLGSPLTSVIYVLDEPSVGLHQADNQRLLSSLLRLRDAGNTVIVVEHDEETIMAADYVFDIGPGAGIYGGHIISEGSPSEMMADPNSITGAYLSGTKKIAVPVSRRTPRGSMSISGACANNLANIDVNIPLGAFICVTGVSGSGKSTLIMNVLYESIKSIIGGRRGLLSGCKDIQGVERIEKCIHVDQLPIGRTPLSNPATYTGVFNHIRDLFASLPESSARGYKVGRFSFNGKGGRCIACSGGGTIKVEMYFLPDVYVKCKECDGKRYNKETLEITYRGRNIYDVLCMTVDQASDFFHLIPCIKEKLVAMQEVGLGYLPLGQCSTTISGGEAQRIKLSKELFKRSSGNTLYILDEPTTGLHFEDIRKLINVLSSLVDKGNTVIVIEHNLNVIKTADHIIDIGPGNGPKGGRVVATGSPEEIVQASESLTGKFLAPLL